MAYQAVPSTQQYPTYIIQGTGGAMQPSGVSPQRQQPVYQIAQTNQRGPAPSYTQASSSSGFSQHLQQHGMSPQQRVSPPPQQSSLARAVYKAKTSAVLDSLPDDDVRRLFVVMFEKHATQVVASQVQGKREGLARKREEERRREEEANKEEVQAQLANVVSMLDDDDD